MRSSHLAAEAGVTVETLRYYERRGLLPEPERSESGYRSYGTEAVQTVRFVKSAQQLGFSLEEIDEGTTRAEWTSMTHTNAIGGPGQTRPQI